MTIGEIARERVVTASPDETVKSIAASMAEHDVGCIVIAERGEPIGLITDRKLALQLRDTPDLASRQVKEFMTTGLVTVHEDDGVKETMDALAEAGIRRVPIVNDDDEIIGIVSIDDLAVMLAEEVEDIEQVLVEQSPRF